jgi:hypothetical protein
VGAHKTKCVVREVTGRRRWIEPAAGCNRLDRHWCREANEQLPSEPLVVQEWFWALGGWNGHLFIFVEDQAKATDFSMDTCEVASQVAPWLRISFSKTLLVFHATLVALLFLVLISTY